MDDDENWLLVNLKYQKLKFMLELEISYIILLWITHKAMDKDVSKNVQSKRNRTVL